MMFCVPAMWKGFIRIAQARYGGCGEQEFQQLLGENLKVGISAGAKLDAESVKVLLNSGIYFLNSWGMTEIGTSTMGGIDEDPSTDYVGCFYNKHKAKILLEDGTYVDNGVGELVLDGHSLYESILIGGKEVFREGPFRSGDIFKLDGTAHLLSGSLQERHRHRLRREHLSGGDRRLFRLPQRLFQRLLHRRLSGSGDSVCQPQGL